MRSLFPYAYACACGDSGDGHRRRRPIAGPGNDAFAEAAPAQNHRASSEPHVLADVRSRLSGTPSRSPTLSGCSVAAQQCPCRVLLVVGLHFRRRLIVLLA